MKAFKEGTSQEQINSFFDLCEESSGYLATVQHRALEENTLNITEDTSMEDMVFQGLELVFSKVEEDPAKHFMNFLNSFDQKALRDLIEDICPLNTQDLDTKALTGKPVNQVTKHLIREGHSEVAGMDFPEEDVRRFWELVLGIYDPSYFYNLRDLITEVTRESLAASKEVAQ